LQVNRPVHRGALSMILTDMGVSPLFILKDQHGRSLDAGYVSLNVLRGREDSFRFDGAPHYRFQVRMQPDHEGRGYPGAAAAPELRIPGFHLTVEREGTRVFNGIVQRGSAVSFQDLRLEFPDMRYWAELQIVREYGSFPLIAGFLCAAAGLLMRLVFYQRRAAILLTDRPGGVTVSVRGTSEYFPEAFREELDLLLEHLGGYLRGGMSAR